MRRFALVSQGLPPSQAGQAMVLYHLLKGFNSADYCLITQKNFQLYHTQGKHSTWLLARYYFFYPDYQVIRFLIAFASLLHLRFLLNFILKIRVWQIKKILKREAAQAVIACTADLFDPPAAYIASRDLQIPFICYGFDYYSYQGINSVTKDFAESYEREIICGAFEIVVPNECMAKEYFDRYSVRSQVIHNPFDLTEYEKNAALFFGKTDLHEKDRKIKIVYTGSVYEAHYDAFQNLLAAIPLTDVSGLKLHLYTPQSELRLHMNAIVGPVVIYKPRPNQEMAYIQRNADILFLPLAFKSPYPNIIKTSAPGKLGEYLASKRPILVHAPKDSFISWYFRRFNCGLVVDTDNPKELAQAIKRLVNDKELCQTITQNAYYQAKTDFDVSQAQKKFSRIVNNLPML